MAELVIPDGFGQCTWKWSVVGRANPISTSIGVKLQTGATPGDTIDEVSAIISGAGSYAFPSNMRTPFSYLGADGVFNVGGDMIGVSSDTGAAAGTASSTGTNLLSSTLLIRKRSALIGRHNRGRMYMPCMLPQESDIDYMGNLDEAAVGFMTAINDVFNDSVFASDNFFPVILHATPGLTPTFVTSFQFQSKTATQRRRLR